MFTGSKEERADLKNAYLTGKGNMDYIVDHVQFARTEHEPRHKEILNVSIGYKSCYICISQLSSTQ